MSDPLSTNSGATSVGQSRASLLSRVLVGVAGVILLLAALALSAGLALAGPLGMIGAAGIQRQRSRVATRSTSWLGAVVGCAIAFALVAVFFLSRRLPAGSMDAVQHQVTVEQQRNPPKVPGALGRLYPDSAEAAHLEAQSRAMTSSKLFLWLVMLMGGGLTCGFVGVVIGSAAWGGATLTWYGLAGRWPWRASDVEATRASDD